MNAPDPPRHSAPQIYEHGRQAAAEPDLRAWAATLEPFLGIGVAAIIAGGIVAAATHPAGWEHGSWAAAFLVLVGGVGQIGLALGQSLLAAFEPTKQRRMLQAVAYDAGAALVIGGTLTTSPLVVTLGSVAMLVALVAFALTPQRPDRAGSWAGRAFRLLLVVLIVSVPIGIVLSWVRR